MTLSLLLATLCVVTIVQAQPSTPTQCANLCTSGTCQGMRGSTLQTCLTTCGQTLAACAQAKAMQFASTLMTDQMDVAARLAEIKMNFSNAVNMTVADVKAKCNEFCTEKAPPANLTACQNVCNGITDIQTGLQALGDFLAAAARQAWAKIEMVDPNGAANVTAAVAALKDAIATQRAFFNDTRSAIVALLDARISDLAQARETRRTDFVNLQAGIQNYIAELKNASNKTERDAIRATGKANLQAAIQAAWTEFNATRANWSATAKALEQQVVAANQNRLAGQKVVVADLKNLRVAVSDLLTQLQVIDPSAAVTASSSSGMKRQSTASASVAVLCVSDDDTCNMQFDNVMSGAVGSSADASPNESATEESSFTPTDLNAIDPYPGDDASSPSGTTGAGTTGASTTSVAGKATTHSSAAAVAMSLVAALLAIASTL